MRLVFSPWSEDFDGIIRSARRQLSVAAPYFSGDVLQRIVERKRRGVKVDFLLSLSQNEVRAGVQSATAVRLLRDTQNCRVRLVNNLHAKFLLSDRRRALVTSSNMTQSGLSGNLELGVFIDDKAAVQVLASKFDQWFSKGNRIPPAVELDKLCRMQRKEPNLGNGVDYGARISLRGGPRQQPPSEQPQGWILVHSKDEYPSGTVEDPEMEMEKYNWRPDTWNWRHGKHGLKEDGSWRTLLLAWDGKVFCEARANVGPRPAKPFNVQFRVRDCTKREKVSLKQLDVPLRHHGLIRLTTAMLDKYHALAGCSVDQ